MGPVRLSLCLLVGMATLSPRPTLAFSSDLDCPSGNCSCIQGVNSDYEILCPRNLLHQPSLAGQIRPGDSVQLQCTAVMTSWDSYKLLHGLNIGPVRSFILRMCPLPEGSFLDLMRAMGVPSTKSLQVQSFGNLSESLTRRHLEGLQEIAQLNLNSNYLTRLPEDLFTDLVNLTWLDLKNNKIQLPKGIFRPLPKLEVLELGSNNLSWLEPGIFRNLTKLRLLNLWGNQLRNLTRSVFTDVLNVESLDISSNGLNTLMPDIFADLAKVKRINLSLNDFISLPQGLFLGNPFLEYFQLSFNRRTLRSLPSGLLSNLTHLKTIKIDRLNLTSIPEDLLWGSPAVQSINLQFNQLTHLPEDIFRDTRDLNTLNLSYNKLTSLPDSVFYSLERLTSLDISNNRLTTLSDGVFQTLRQLETLKLDHNLIHSIHGHTFQGVGRLTALDLSYNRLSNVEEPSELPVGRQSLFRFCIKLEELRLAHNNITTLYPDWQISMVALRVLDLSYNALADLSVYQVQFLSSNILVDLSYNNISTILLDGAESIAKIKFGSQSSQALENRSVKVILKGNPLICDCHAFHLVRYFRGEMEPEVNYIADFDGHNLTCSGPRDIQGQLVKNLDPRILTCQVEPTTCPNKCSCYFRPYNRGLLIDCSNLGLISVPASLPLYESLVANHTELDLRSNRIKALPPVLGQGYDKVTKLYLNDNNLTSINITSLSPQLEVLELDGNNLTRIDDKSLKILQDSESLQKITLHNNPWACDCQTKYLLNFLQASYKKVQHLDNITCQGGTLLSKVTANELCPTSTLAIALGILVAFFGLLLGGCAAAYYRYQQEIKVWLFAHNMCLWFVTEEELDKDKVYDAFVSYSHLDENFVVNKLVPGLESGPNTYKLCLHYRDWIVGEFIPNQIAKSVEESRRTLVVLSPAFLQSVWGRMEFKTAHQQALSEGRARVIVILYGDIGPLDTLDTELKAYLSMNTYVKWGDPWFWEKLRFALPHPPQPLKSLPLISRSSNTNLLNSGKAQSDKSGLICNGGDSNGTALNTPPASNPIIMDPLSLISKPV